MAGDHEHQHDHPDHDDHEPMPAGFEDVSHWLNEQACVALAEEGGHASVVFLGLPNGQVRAQRFDATGQHDVADAWGRVATWAKGIGANAVYFVGEAKRSDETEHTDPEDEEDVLVFASLNAEGVERTFETPFTRDEEGNVTVGTTERSDAVAVTFNEFRELWGLPLLETEPEPEPDAA
jgi:hypothetical protein